MARVTIPLVALEFDEGGDTLWFQGIGGTVFRLKTTGGIHTRTCIPSDAPPASRAPAVSHGDLLVTEPVEICLGNDKDIELDPEKPLGPQITRWLHPADLDRYPSNRSRKPGEKEFDIVESGGEYVMSGTWQTLQPDDPRYVDIDHGFRCVADRTLMAASVSELTASVSLPRKPAVIVGCVGCGWKTPLKNNSAMVLVRSHTCHRVEQYETRAASKSTTT